MQQKWRSSRWPSTQPPKTWKLEQVENVRPLLASLMEELQQSERVNTCRDMFAHPQMSLLEGTKPHMHDHMHFLLCTNKQVCVNLVQMGRQSYMLVIQAVVRFRNQANIIQ